MTQKLTETVKLDKATKKRLERLKKGEFKRRYKTRSINDVIKKLLEIWDEYQILKAEKQEKTEEIKVPSKEKLLKELRETKLEYETLPMEKSICYDCAKFSSCNYDWIHDIEEIKEHGCFVPRNQCVFRSEREDGKIDCAKDFAKTGKIHVVSKEFCDKCWERKKAIRERIQRKRQDEYYCILKSRYYKVSELNQLECIIKNPSWHCPNVACFERLKKFLEVIGWEGKELI